MNRMTSAVSGTTWSSALRVPRILWAALLASTFVYGFLIVGGVLSRGTDESLRWVFPGVALVTAILSFALPALVTRGLPKLDLATREEIDQGAESLFRDAAVTHRVVLDPTEARAKYVGSRHSPYVVGLAMSETPALLGLVAWIVTDLPLPLCLAMVALSVVLIASRFPLTARWRADAEKQLGATIPD